MCFLIKRSNIKEKVRGSDMRLEELLQIFVDKRNREELYAYALSLTKNEHDAEDLLSDLLILIYEKPEMQNAREPMAYFKTCLRYRYYNIRQRNKKMVPADSLDISQNYSNEGDYTGHLEELETRAKLRKSLSDYSDELIEAFEKFYLEGYSQKEVAASLGISPNTLSQQFRRMRMKLRKTYPVLYTTIMIIFYLR